MKKAQQAQVKVAAGHEMPLQRGIKDSERKELRQKVLAAANKFLDRCYSEQCGDEVALEAHRDKLS
jgi:hypothetical protein